MNEKRFEVIPTEFVARIHEGCYLNYFNFLQENFISILLHLFKIRLFRHHCSRRFNTHLNKRPSLQYIT